MGFRSLLQNFLETFQTAGAKKGNRTPRQAQRVGNLLVRVRWLIIKKHADQPSETLGQSSDGFLQPLLFLGGLQQDRRSNQGVGEIGLDLA